MFKKDKKNTFIYVLIPGIGLKRGGDSSMWIRLRIVMTMWSAGYNFSLIPRILDVIKQSVYFHISSQISVSLRSLWTEETNDRAMLLVFWVCEL